MMPRIGIYIWILAGTLLVTIFTVPMARGVAGALRRFIDIKIDSAPNRYSELIPSGPYFLVISGLAVLFFPPHYFLSH